MPSPRQLAGRGTLVRADWSVAELSQWLSLRDLLLRGEGNSDPARKKPGSRRWLNVDSTRGQNKQIETKQNSAPSDGWDDGQNKQSRTKQKTEPPPEVREDGWDDGQGAAEFVLLRVQGSLQAVKLRHPEHDPPAYF